MIASILAVAGCAVALLLLARRGEAGLERLWGGLLARPSALAAVLSRLRAIERAHRSTSRLAKSLRSAGESSKAARVEAAGQSLAKSTQGERRVLERVRSVVTEKGGS